MDAGKSMSMGAKTDPCAMITIKCIDLELANNQKASAAICDFFNKKLKIPTER